MAMQSQWRVTMVVGSLWVISLLYGEMFAFWVPRISCAWPSLELNGTFVGNDGVGARPIKIALIADPQITHQTGNGVSPTTSKFSEFYSDIYMRRAFRSAVLEMKPDLLVIIGDLLEGGHLLSDEEFQLMERRFEHVFDQSARGVGNSERVPVYYLPGSQDLGSAEIQAQRLEIVQRNEATFGSLEYIVPTGGMEFVFTNARAFNGLESSIQANVTWGLLDTIPSDHKPPPRVLLTAIPLFKPSDSPCTSRDLIETTREEKVLADKSEENLSLDTSATLLNITKPVIVISGHGKEGCATTHETPYGSITEHTVGTFNWQQENLRPSFMMISLAPESVSGPELVSTSICFLPVQTWIYTWYAFLFLSGFVAIFAWPTHGVDFADLIHKGLQYSREIFRPDGGVKAKDEDADNGDWEMMWDAEGGMHLVKSQKIVTTTKSTVQGVDRRGTAQARPAAKRQGGMETESSIIMEPNLSAMRTNKTRNRVFPNRFWYVLGPLTVLTSLDLSLYVMLLMKDWT